MSANEIRVEKSKTENNVTQIKLYFINHISIEFYLWAAVWHTLFGLCNES